ncbi:MAG: hypothetical protein VX346_28740 [Planctomycetota bacterium]|nr:hypothetical protein [Planctomycetota bacterium]
MNLTVITVACALLGEVPSAGYMYPPVVPAGAVTEVQLGGYEFTPDVEFFSPDPQVTITKRGPLGKFIVAPPPYWFGQKSMRAAFLTPREVPARIRVAEGKPSGSAYWQVANAGGASRCVPFLVDAGNIVVENRHRDTPQMLETLPVIVAARLGKIAEIDEYQFVATQDGLVTAELITHQIGSLLTGAIEVGETGKDHRLGDAVDLEGKDIELTFAVKAGKSYSLRVFDVQFRGNRAFVYALRLSLGPRVIMTRPVAGRRGRSCDVDFIGYGLQNGTSTLQSVTRKVDFPDQETAAFAYSLDTPVGTALVSFPLRDTDEVVGRGRTEIACPVVVNGALAEVGVEDRYTAEMKAGDSWAIAVEAAALGSPLDPTLRVLAPDGSEIAKFDKAGDCALTFKAVADGPHVIVVGDISAQAGTPLSVYRLVVEVPPLADFSLSVPQTINFEPGGKASATVKLARLHGYAGNVAVGIEGLPKGVSVPADLVIPAGKSELKFELSASTDCSGMAAYVRVVGVGRRGDVTLTRVASTDVGQLTSVLLTPIISQVPITIAWVLRETQHERPRGSTFPAELEIKRQEGYDGEIWLMPHSKQSRHRQGITGPIMKVPSGVDRILYPVFIPEWLETFRTSRMVVLAMAKVVDAQGTARYVQAKSGRLCWIVEGALMKVDGRDAEITASPGDKLEVTVDILRRPKFTEDVTLEVVAADDVDGLFKAAPVVVPSGKRQATIQVETMADPRLYPEQKLKIRATALEDGKWLAVSETDVTVVFRQASAARRTP